MWYGGGGGGGEPSAADINHEENFFERKTFVKSMLNYQQ